MLLNQCCSMLLPVLGYSDKPKAGRCRVTKEFCALGKTPLTPVVRRVFFGGGRMVLPAPGVTTPSFSSWAVQMAAPQPMLLLPARQCKGLWLEFTLTTALPGPIPQLLSHSCFLILLHRRHSKPHPCWEPLPEATMNYNQRLKGTPKIERENRGGETISSVLYP